MKLHNPSWKHSNASKRKKNKTLYYIKQINEDMKILFYS